jgi:hypothetical protein
MINRELSLVHYFAGLLHLMTSLLDINVVMQLHPVYLSLQEFTCFDL